MSDPNKKFYFQQRNQNRIYEIMVKFIETYCVTNQVRKRDLAQAIGVSPSQLSHWLAGPANWTIDTVSDLLFAVSAEMDYAITPFSERVRANYFHPLVNESQSKMPATQDVNAVQQKYSISNQSEGWKVLPQTNGAFVGSIDA